MWNYYLVFIWTFMSVGFQNASGLDCISDHRCVFINTNVIDIGLANSTTGFHYKANYSYYDGELTEIECRSLTHEYDTYLDYNGIVTKSTVLMKLNLASNSSYFDCKFSQRGDVTVVRIFFLLSPKEWDDEGYIVNGLKLRKLDTGAITQYTNHHYYYYDGEPLDLRLFNSSLIRVKCYLAPDDLRYNITYQHPSIIFDPPFVMSRVKDNQQICCYIGNKTIEYIMMMKLRLRVREDFQPAVDYSISKVLLKYVINHNKTYIDYDYNENDTVFLKCTDDRPVKWYSSFGHIKLNQNSSYNSKTNTFTSELLEQDLENKNVSCLSGKSEVFIHFKGRLQNNKDDDEQKRLASKGWGLGSPLAQKPETNPSDWTLYIIICVSLLLLVVVVATVAVFYYRRKIKLHVLQSNQSAIDNIVSSHNNRLPIDNTYTDPEPETTNAIYAVPYSSIENLVVQNNDDRTKEETYQHSNSNYEYSNSNYGRSIPNYGYSLPNYGHSNYETPGNNSNFKTLCSNYEYSNTSCANDNSFRINTNDVNDYRNNGMICYENNDNSYRNNGIIPVNNGNEYTYSNNIPEYANGLNVNNDIIYVNNVSHN